MSAALFLLLAISPEFIFSYNIDTSYPIVFVDPDSNKATNNFGYTVTLSTRIETSGALNLFVGAPNSANGEGKVYRCTETRNGDQLTPSCRGLGVLPASAPKYVNIVGTNRVLITGRSRGLGSSMAMGESSNLTVCAPYSIINSKWKHEINASNLDDMRGFCYNVPNAVGNILHRDNEQLAFEQRYPIGQMINTLYGFSVDYAKEKGTGVIDRIIGQPRLNKLDIKGGLLRKKLVYTLNELDNYGYSVSSGYFFNDKNIVFVAGAPGWMRKGKFVYTEQQSNGLLRETSYQGSVLGEYFGASLATGDFDQDGLDDLAVGAPHWGEADFGRVYIFFGNKIRIFTKGPILQGLAEYGQFGYTLASADLDSDSRSDLVVSAPWEESGVVYIYYGSRDFRSQDSSSRITQRIKPSEFVPPIQVQRFGFSLSRPVDFDNNGYPDLAIGAYKSGHAVVLRSRPVIKTEVELISDPRTLQNSTERFVVRVCVKYTGIKSPETQEFRFRMIMDEDHKRVKDGSVREFSETFHRNRFDCSNQTIELLKGNFLDPILINVTHWIDDRARTEFCPSCPVLDRNNFGESKIIKVPFNTGCEQEICHSKLSVTANLGGTGPRHEWVVGSGDLSLDIDVKNEQEPAHQTQLIIDIPARIRLRNVISFCTEKKNGTENAVTLVCDIDKPIGPGETKSLGIVLDMGQIFDSIEESEMIFNITRRTRSEDHGDGPNPTTVSLKVKNVAYVTLTGLADSESINYHRTENKSMVRIRHTYQVLKKGETPITEAELTIDVPVSSSGRNNSFLSFNDATFTDSTGNFHKCFIDNVGYQIGNTSPLESTPNINLVQRRRRDNSADSEEAPIENSSERPIARTTDQIIYLNCSSDDFTCVRVTCLFQLIKTSDDMGNMVLNMDFDANAFYTSNENSLTVKFNTNASVKIILPLKLDPTYLRNTTADVTTMLYNIPEPQKLAGWIVPVSIILGILLLIILVLVLFKLGFFKRSQKLQTAKAKERELILNTGGDKDGDDDEDAERFS